MNLMSISMGHEVLGWMMEHDVLGPRVISRCYLSIASTLAALGARGGLPFIFSNRLDYL
jgi:hypothetical protein